MTKIKLLETNFHVDLIGLTRRGGRRMSDLGLDTFLPAVPMGMSGLAEVMAALAGFPEIAAPGTADRYTTPTSGPTQHVRGLPPGQSSRPR